MPHYLTPDGRIIEASLGRDAARRYRSFVGGDRAIFGQDRALLGLDNDDGGAAIASLESQVAAARAAGGLVAADKSVVPVAFHFILPFSRDIPAGVGSRVQLQLHPQRDFRVDNLIITSPEGPFFELHNWTVGQDNMFVAQGSVNCAAFSEGAAQKGLGLRGYTANNGTLIILDVENRDTNPHRISGFLSGPSLIALG